MTTLSDVKEKLIEKHPKVSGGFVGGICELEANLARVLEAYFLERTPILYTLGYIENQEELSAFCEQLFEIRDNILIAYGFTHEELTAEREEAETEHSDKDLEEMPSLGKES